MNVNISRTDARDNPNSRDRKVINNGMVENWEKHQKVDQDETTERASDDPENTENCYFSQVRKHVLEKHDRPIKSVVSTKCSGTVSKLGNRKLVEKMDGQDSLSLLFCRGAGLCDLDFSKQEVLNQWNDVKICDHHLNELLVKWGKHRGGYRGKHMYRKRTSYGTQYACSMPSTVGDNHYHHRPTRELQPLTIAESNAILIDRNILVHPGIPICSAHKTFVQELIATQSTPPPKKAKIDYAECDDTEESVFDQPYLPPGNKAGNIKRSFINFANNAGVPRTCSIIPWDKMKITTKERKASAARRLIDTMLNLMVPDQTEDFQKLVEKKFIQMDSWTTGSSEKLDIIMSQIAAQYFVAEDRNTRILILSLIANSVPLASVEKYIPGLTSYMYHKAKKFARRKRGTQLETHAVMERYNKEAVEAFIGFITRLHVKQTSRVADHCAVYALSDPDDSALAESCSIGPDAHTHNVKCDRCERTKAILDVIEEHAREFVDEKKKDVEHPDADDADKLFFSKHKEELELIEKYKKNIFEMKKHLLRAAVTNDERNTIIEDLRPGEALITLDFAQKFLPK
ncbi:hypothetical protein B9Z55_003117 [Caenorhabditis nigoni]|uniref:Uncharacterized protein n=1 Tax=Caenorhabditis nigoni TaxID=1611254 RepID=A0A2G5VP29_9PELO|nr:hypothetical protein B9Z55_003117 [Caenorhabditis nigoni]